MKKWIKILIKVLLSIVLILLIAAYFSISRIDTTPYFETSYYKNTIEKFDKQISDKKTSNGSLLAGFAKVNITPEIVTGNEDPKEGKFNKIKLAGFGSGKYATGVHDSIYAKAIAMQVDQQTVILISADLLMTPKALVDNVIKRLKENNIDISREQIYFGATHTHCSIGNCVQGYIGEAFEGPYQEQVIEWLGAKYAQVITSAISDEKSAEFSSGYIHVPNVIRNRIIGETGRLNDKLTIVSIKQDQGKQAAIGVFAAHATIIGSWNDQFSAEYPGEFQRSLENKGIDMAMFFAGTVGSHTNKGEGEKFDKVKFVGQTLADSAKVVIDRLEYTKTVTLTSIATEIERPKLQFLHISDNLRLAPWLGNKLMTDITGILLQGFRINDLIWTAMPYELSGEYAIDLKNALEIKGYNSVFTSFNGQYLGYIVPARYYYYDTYEARLMGWYGPSMGDYLMELNYKMANNLIGSKL